jgi:RNA polymerase sigma factor (sigma-70 family)
VTTDSSGRPIPQEESHRDIESLVRATHDEAVRVAFRILRNHADTEDAVQTAYVRVTLNWSFVASLPTAENQHAYLRTVVRNEALQIIRRRDRRREDLGFDRTESLHIAEHLEEQAQAREDLRLAWQAISKLPEGRQEVVIRYATGYEYREIAEMLGIGVTTVRSHISNARKQLRQAMPGDGEGNRNE